MPKRILSKIFGNRSIFKFALTLVLIFAVFLMVNFFIYFNKTAETLGTAIGHTAGTIKGVATGIRDATQDAIDDAINVDDYEIEIRNTMVESEKLEVLVASAAIRNDFTVGTQYEAMYIYKGDAIFTVDLSQVNVSKDGANRIKVIAPEPVVDFVIDEDETEKVMEMQYGYFTGSKEGGYEAYIIHRNEIDEHLEETIVGYDALIESAKESAIRQLTSLARSVSGRDIEVVIEFSAEEVK